MKLALESFRRARLPALVACWLLSFAAAAGASAPLAVAPAQADPALAPIALGFDRWLESSLRSAGREVVLLPGTGTAGGSTNGEAPGMASGAASRTEAEVASTRMPKARAR